MKKFLEFFKPSFLPGLTVIAGVLALVLRILLQVTGIDEKGLLVAGHFAGVALYILTALFLVVLFLCVWSVNNLNRYSKLFPPSLLGAAGCVFAAVGVLYTGAEQIFRQSDILTLITALVAVVAAVCLVRIGMLRQKGQRPSYLLYTAVTLYLMLHLVCQYRFWSPESQFLLYFFPLLASVFLTLTAYQATCMTAKKGIRWQYVFFNQAALFFCFVALISRYWVFYLAMGLWAGTNLCSTRIVRPRNNKEA